MNGAYGDGYGAASPNRRAYGERQPVQPPPVNGSVSDDYDPYSSDTRRLGGHGGFGPAPTRAAGRRLYGQPQGPPVTQFQAYPQPTQQTPLTTKPVQLERQRAQRRSRSRSRGPALEGQAAQDIHDILRYIQRDWSFMTEDKCIPAQVALQLLDDSSLGLGSRYHDFQDTQEQLQSTLRAIVNEHHQGFNSSIGTFHQIQSSIASSHERIIQLRTSLVQAKGNLSSAKPEFTTLARASHNYQDMLDVLITIEHIQQLPDKLETSTSEKRFLTAVELLQDALRMIRRPELEGIGALEDTRVYLSNQEHSLFDILVEELHNHLYLKSPYCEDRWQAYTKAKNGRHHLRSQQYGKETLFDFLDKLDTSQVINDDASRNPEADSFQYIYMTAEALNRLGRLSDAIDTIEERLPVELFKVVERSNAEIQQRHPSTLKVQWNSGSSLSYLSGHDEKDAPILTDLLETLYAKLEAIAESHRVFHEILSGIASRDTACSTAHFTKSFRELWKLYQSEMRSLLHDYLSTRGTIAERMRKGDAAESSIFKYQRDKGKKTPFKMDLVDASVPDLRSEREDLMETWQHFVPGIVSLVSGNSARVLNSNNVSEGGSAAGHRLLVEPSVFNIVHLLPPSVSFLHRLKAIVPATSNVAISTLSSFLSDFLINVFHPQLEDTLNEYCSACFTMLDAFQQDPQWEVHSDKPIYKGTVVFYDIVTSFSKILDDLTHDQIFSLLIITQINSYYDKCMTWFKTLVARAQAKNDGRATKQAALLAEYGQIADLAKSVWLAPEKERNAAIRNENSALLDVTAKTPLDASDLNADRKTFAQLCLLHTSMTWLAKKLERLRRVTAQAADSSLDGENDTNAAPPQLKRSLTTSLEQAAADVYDDVYLPLTANTATMLDGIVLSFRELASLALRTIHLEIRCNIVFTVVPLFKGRYILHEHVEAADEDVLKLVGDMSILDREMKMHLLPAEYAFVVNGCSDLVDTILVSNATRGVNGLNAIGAEHLELNARVLYHNLINMEAHADLPKTFEFFRLFDEGPNAIVAHAWKGKLTLTHEQLKAIIELWHSEDLDRGDQNKAARAEKVMGEHLTQLSEAVAR